MTTDQMKSRGAFPGIVLLAGLVLVSACTKDGKSLIPVVVDSSDPALSTMTKLTVFVVQGSKAVATVKFAQDPWQTPQNLGVYVPADVSGSVTLSAIGYNNAGAMIAMSDGPAMVTVMAGKTTSPVAMHLVPYASGGGTGGTGGGGGTAPGTGGVGGTSAGSGGMSNPGSGGATGGGPGTGGMLMPGSGGMVHPGSGGAAGAAPGSGGASGMAGHGTGGTGVGGAAGGKSGRAWQGQVLAENSDLLDNYTPALAVHGKGNIFAVYQHGSGLAAAYYDYSKGSWVAETVIDGSAMTNITETTNVAVDKNGNWLAVWQQDPDIPQHGIWQSTSTDGVHWTAPAAITTAGKAFEPVLGVGPDGTAVVVWTDNIQPDNRLTLTASVRVNGTWTAPHVLRAGDDSSERYVAVAVTSTGTAIATWEQGDGTTQNQLSVWQARFSGGAWSAASLVETYTGGNADSANVATNNAGQSILTWIQNTDSTSALWAQRYPATGAPEAPLKIGEGSNIAWTPAPAVTLDDSGTATVAWAFQVKSKFEVYTARGAWGQPWGAVMAMETDDDAADDHADSNDYAWVTSPMVGHDGAGNVALVWKKRTGDRFDMWARNFDAVGGTWGPGTLLETMDTHDVFAPSMAMGPSGVAAAAWYYGYEFDIWANVYR